MSTQRTQLLREQLAKLYAGHQERLLAHGWHHVTFVARKSPEFCAELGADREVVEAAALVHDLNFIADSRSKVEAGAELRVKHLRQSGFSTPETELLEAIVREASVKNRHAGISTEAKALADADSLYKVLPISPVVFSAKFMEETGASFRQWCDAIVRQQEPLLEQGIYFYTKQANEHYLAWAKQNLALIETIQAALDDPDIRALLADMAAAGVLWPGARVD